MMGAMQSGLGLVAKSGVVLKSGKQYDRYFPIPEFKDEIVLNSNDVSQTVKIMGKIIGKYHTDTALIAPILQAEDIYQTCHHIYDFVYNHIEYLNDRTGHEELRRPAVTWHERRGDCDCMSIMISSILYNLGIEHLIRIARYPGRPDYEHVYVIVPHADTHITIDPVLRAYMFRKPENVSMFNYEMPFEQKKDFTMSELGIPVHVLSGISGTMSDEEKRINELIEFSTRRYDNTLEYLQDLRKMVTLYPEMLSSYVKVSDFLQMLEYLIHYWDINREKALEVLQYNEERLRIANKDAENPVLSFFTAIRELSGSSSESGMAGFWDSVKDAIQDVGQGIATVSPINVSMRAAFRLLILENYLGYATKFAIGRLIVVDEKKRPVTEIYKTLEPTGLDLNDIRKFEAAYRKIYKFYEAIGGNGNEKDMWFDVIKKGKGKGAALASAENSEKVRKLRGVLKIMEDTLVAKYGRVALGSVQEFALGEVTVAAAVVSASAAIVAVAEYFKDAQDIKQKELAKTTPKGSGNGGNGSGGDGSGGDGDGGSTPSSSMMIGLAAFLGAIGLGAWYYNKSKKKKALSTASSLKGLPTKKVVGVTIK